MAYFMSWGLHCKSILSNLSMLSCTLHQPVKPYSLGMPLVSVDTGQVDFQLADVILLSRNNQMSASLAEVW